MIALKTSSRSLVTVAKLTAVTIISLGFAITTHGTAANTLVQVRGPKAPPPVRTLSTMTAPRTERRATTVDMAMNVLSLEDTDRYRIIFAAQKIGDWATANAAMIELKDKRLLGHVLADRYQKAHVDGAYLVNWMEHYSDHPEAETIYSLARKNKKLGAKYLPQPTAIEPWSAGYEIDSAANFVAEIKSGKTTQDKNTKRLSSAINRALHKGNPSKARDLLIAAQTKQPLVGTFAADAEAAVAAGFFYMGERDQARSLANAAAVAQQPLGLWIRGLLAWEQNDLTLASASFTRLAGHPALDASAKAAAHFWAYRSLGRQGNTQAARTQLEQAAQHPHSFYGLLASQLLGANTNSLKSQKEKQTVWAAKHRSVLASYPAGWRALALVQVGETALAEMELRRLNPQGQPNLQQAMLALANYVPMPALVLQLASLLDDENEQEHTAMLYPIMPWQPRNGFSVDRALIYALARHESLFDPTAVSSRGARGLMQIMPRTAHVIEAKETVVENEDRLLDPSYNLTLGQKYVHHLASHPKIGDNLLFLLAAYNGGPNKLAKWVENEELRKDGKMDPLLFLESIPQRETRKYVMRVLSHYWVYQMRLNEPLTSLKQLAEGKWPRISLAGHKASVLKVASK